MWIDLLDSSNCISINTNMIKIFGIEKSAYLSLLLSIYRKAYNKKVLEDNKYCILDRQYVEDRLCIPLKEQYVIDKCLADLDIIIKKDKDKIYVDFENIASLLASSNQTELKKIKSKVKSLNATTQKQNKREVVLNMMYQYVQTDSEELNNLLKEWIDNVYDKYGGSINQTIIKRFQKDLAENTNGDLDLAIDIMKSAVISSYKGFAYCYSSYLKEQEAKASISKVRKGRTIVNKENVIEEPNLEEIDTSTAF